MGGGADAGQIFRMSRSTKNHPRAGLLPVGSLLETVGSLSVDRWTRQVRYYGWMRRLLLPLDVGIELWVDPHAPRLCSTGGVGAPDRRRRRCELSRLFHEPDVAPGCLFAAGRIDGRSSYDWAMPTTLPKSGPTIHCKRTLPATTCSGHRGSANTRAARRS